MGLVKLVCRHPGRGREDKEVCPLLQLGRHKNRCGCIETCVGPALEGGLRSPCPDTVVADNVGVARNYRVGPPLEHCHRGGGVAIGHSEDPVQPPGHRLHSVLKEEMMSLR